MYERVKKAIKKNKLYKSYTLTLVMITCTYQK